VRRCSPKGNRREDKIRISLLQQTRQEASIIVWSREVDHGVRWGNVNFSWFRVPNIIELLLIRW